MKIKRVVSTLLIVAFCLSLIPTVAMAAFDAKNVTQDASSTYFGTLQVTDIAKAGDGTLTIKVNAIPSTASDTISYHIGSFELIDGESLAGSTFGSDAIDGEYANSGENPVSPGEFTFTIPSDEYSTDGLTVCMAFATASDTNVAYFTFKLDKDGNWLEPTITMKDSTVIMGTTGKKVSLGLNTALYSDNAGTAVNNGDTVTAVAVVVKDKTNNDVTTTVSGAGYTFAAKYNSTGKTIDIEIPDGFLAAKTGADYDYDGYTLNITATLTGLYDADGKNFAAKDNDNECTVTFASGTDMNATWKDADAQAGAVLAKYGDAPLTRVAETTDTAVLKEITYTSSATDVATVGAKTGVVTILKAGTTTITATVTPNDGANNNGVPYLEKSITYTLTVSEATPEITATMEELTSLDDLKTNAPEVVVTPGATDPATPSAPTTVKYGIVDPADGTSMIWSTGTWGDFVDANVDKIDFDTVIYIAAGQTAVTDKLNAITICDVTNDAATKTAADGLVTAAAGKIDAASELITVTVTKAVTSTKKTVKYVAGEGGKLAEGSVTSEKVKRGEKPVNVPQVVADEGYIFKGWSADGGKTFVKPAEVAVTASVTYTAIFEKADGKHTPYMTGRTTTEFAPMGTLKRDEAATMLSRLTEGFDENGAYTTDKFSDVSTGWFVKYVAFAADKGIINGYEDGTFKPEQNITREEFAKMLACFAKLEPVPGKSDFTDVGDNWATPYINALKKTGAIEGDGNGTFRPKDNITRAEAAKMVNAVLNRAPDKTLVAESGVVNPFTDVAASAWYYADVMEATVEHEVIKFHK